MTSSSRRSGIRLNRPFVGIPTFLRAPIETDLDALDADIAVYGVPFDEGSPFLAGSRMGPRSIREHSLRFAASAAGLYDPETGRTYLAHELANRTIADVGDVDVWPTDVKSTFDNATDLTRAVLARGALPLVLGGDHSVTYPIVKGSRTRSRCTSSTSMRISTTRRSSTICASPTATHSVTSRRWTTC